MSTAIKIENLSKQYRLGVINTGTLSHDLNRWWTVNILHKDDPYLKIGDTNDRATRGSSEYVWALKDINMEIEQGDVVGIIGKNGAGKSTLLKILSRVTKPTTGSISYKGRIASLLEVGTGFHPEMTGRENIYMNGAIMGMSRAEVSRKLDEIVDFAGVERYLDTPVKRYSSGMTVRLGFAIAAHLEPEILVVDEVLAVGDAEFQKKAIGKMQDVSHSEGRTVLFVSHNMGAIRNLCKHCVVLNNGMLSYEGNVNDAIDYYISNVKNYQRNENFVEITNKQRDMNRSLDVYFMSFEQMKKSTEYATDENIVLRITIHARKARKNCRINCTVFDAEDTPIGNNSSINYFDINSNETKVLEYTIVNPNLVCGTYFVSFSVGIGNMIEGETNFDVVQKVVSFEITKFKKDSDMFYSKWTNGWGKIYIDSKTKEL